MKSKYVDVLMILVITVFLIAMNEIGILEKYVEFIIIPMLAVYFVGKYVQRKFCK
ncbi:hypothetical protein [Salibacter halophilus]|uniref:hypothetical protein n=1 Tax=Salibacter halophilus TaxID=1803916 RepID=UPI0014792C88|nr:hypothetical protein [Salibacter halophilus]